jgi:Rps23 Pro-64 3,4-dihydroxylase Tpa1-like proline 4-hydroxylase
MIDLAPTADLRFEPFSHTTAAGLFSPEICAPTLDWMEGEAPWKLRIGSFYEQWELHIEPEVLPTQVKALATTSTIDRLAATMLAPLKPRTVELTEITAHKLLPGQTIRVHNDFLQGNETHRLLIQLNRGWRDEQGGMLMLFSSSSPDDVCRVLRPLNGSAVAFPITSRSFHAVSTVRAGERYTLVYSFKEAATR